MSDAKKPTKAATLSTIAALAEKISFSVSKDAAIESTTPTVFADTLPEGLTVEQYALGQSHNMNFTVAHDLSATKHALAHWADNNEQTKLEFSTPGIGDDSFNTTVEASRNYPRKDKETGESSDNFKYGVVTSSREEAGHAKSIFTNSLAETREAIEKLFAK